MASHNSKYCEKYSDCLVEIFRVFKISDSSVPINMQHTLGLGFLKDTKKARPSRIFSHILKRVGKGNIQKFNLLL